MERCLKNKSLTNPVLILSCSLLVGALIYTLCIPYPPTTRNELSVVTAQADPRDIPSSESLYLEELTWMEVRDKISTGTHRIIVPTGGIEQNGPYLPLNKHNIIVKEMSLRIAKQLGSTLVSSVIPFVPEGDFLPASGHMLYPGTVSVRQESFESLLIDIISSHLVHGFKEVLVLGDSGGSQNGMAKAAAFAASLAPEGATVRFIPEFYNYPQLRTWLKEKGYQEEPARFHDELVFSLQLLAINPELIHYRERAALGSVALNGITLAPLHDFQSLGAKLLEFRTKEVVKAIQRTTPPLETPLTTH